MLEVENESGTHVTPVRAREYTARSVARHRNVGTIRRLVFFSLASVWGFIVGVGGLLVALSAAGQPVHPRPGAIPGLIPSLIFAVSGGLVVAAAYRESKRRSR